MFEWSQSLFDTFYLAFKRRKTVEELVQRKIMMDNALHANSAFYKTKDGVQARDEIIKEYTEKVDQIIFDIYDSRTPEEIESAEQEDPFLQAMNLSHTIVEDEVQKEDQVQRGERSLALQ